MHHRRLLGREHSTKKILIDNTQRKIKSTDLSKHMCINLRVSPSIITFAVGRLYHLGLQIRHLISVQKNLTHQGSVEKHYFLESYLRYLDAQRDPR